MPTTSRSATNIEPEHPGEILRHEFMAPWGLSANALTRRIQVPGNRISAIVAGRRGITADTALRLAAVFSTTPEFWLNLQKSWELEGAKDALPAQELAAFALNH